MSRKPSTTPADDLATLRARISALQDERQELESQRRSRDEVAAMLDGMISIWHRQGLANLAREVQHAASGEPSDFLMLQGIGAVTAAPGVAQINLQVGPLLCAVLGPQAVKSAFAAAIEAIPSGMPAPARKARLEAIAQQLDELEADEEAIIDASGGQFERRENVRPEIVLAAGVSP